MTTPEDISEETSSSVLPDDRERRRRAKPRAIDITKPPPDYGGRSDDMTSKDRQEQSSGGESGSGGLKRASSPVENGSGKRLKQGMSWRPLISSQGKAALTTGLIDIETPVAVFGSGDNLPSQEVEKEELGAENSAATATTSSGNEIGLLAEAAEGLLATIRRQNAENEDLRARISNLEENVAKRDAQNQVLTTKNRNLQQEVALGEDMIASLDSENAALRQQC